MATVGKKEKKEDMTYSAWVQISWKTSKKGKQNQSEENSPGNRRD